MSSLRHLVTAALLALALGGAPSAATAAPLADDRLADVAERVVESVVNVSSSQQVQLGGPAGLEPLFDDPRSPFYVPPDQRQQRAAGSGVIVSADGRVLTNAHVVAEADAITVMLSDGSELEADMVGVDRQTDLAVLQLRGPLPPLTPLPLGDSTTLRLGEVVLAVGNPFGIGQSVSMGIVSATGRGALGMVDYEDFIQTDAAINPGNSGGALVNLAGELVGINTAIASRTGGYDGIGFAIPTSMAKPVMDALVAHGKVVRSYLGVQLAPLTRAYIAEHKVPAKKGVVIAGVMEGTPAAQAKLQPGDVVIAADGQPVGTVAQLRNYVALRGVGVKVELELLRAGAVERVRVTTAALPDPNAPAAPPPTPAKQSRKRRAR